MSAIEIFDYYILHLLDIRKSSVCKFHSPVTYFFKLCPHKALNNFTLFVSHIKQQNHSRIIVET